MVVKIEKFIYFIENLGSMKYYELQKKDLENILSEMEFNTQELTAIQKDMKHYDKYYIIVSEKNIGFIKIWKQTFKDPYMKLQIDNCDLVSFKGGAILVSQFIDVLDQIFCIPQVIRCSETDVNEFAKRGFERIEDKICKATTIHPSSVLINIVKYVKFSQGQYKSLPQIRQMTPEDITSITEIFKKEYPARYRAVRLLYEYDKSSCFVYDDGVIKGALFAELREDHLYVHQILVKEEFRGKTVSESLLGHAYSYAQQKEKGLIRGTIRGNLLKYYSRMGVEEDTKLPKSRYLVRISPVGLR